MKTSHARMRKTPPARRNRGEEPPRTLNSRVPAAAKKAPRATAGSSGRRNDFAALPWSPRAPATLTMKQEAHSPVAGGLPSATSPTAVAAKKPPSRASAPAESG